MIEYNNAKVKGATSVYVAIAPLIVCTIGKRGIYFG